VTPEHYSAVRALYEAVAELPAGERAAQLRSLTSEPLLITDVLALFDAGAAAAPGWITRPVSGAIVAFSQPSPSVGEVIGAWKIVAEIGAGGMGRVYLVQRCDGHFEQAAALKLLRGLPSSEALERLAQERQILAKLTHPNIARLLDGGATASGQPYLVMEYVEGEAIDHYCQQQQLPLSEILRLLISICDCVGFAHQRLIVHCDLKPANILVNQDGRPLLLDFGIARLLNYHADDSNAVADTGVRAFTPGYASPEQRAGLGVSTATDIYGLGRVLEVLTCVWVALGTSKPVAQVGVESKIPRALRAVIARATADDPAQRYPSASTMAEDLRRYLLQQPVSAMGNDRWYRLRCGLRRNVLALSMGSIALLALVGGLLSSMISLQQTQIAGARAERTAGFLGNLLRAVDPDQARNLDTRLLRSVLDNAARTAKTELADEPLVLAEISTVIGQTYHQISEYAQAIAQFQQALALLPPEHLRQRLNVREQMANAQGALGTGQQALVGYQAVLSERMRAFGADDPDTLKSEHTLVYQWVENGEFKRALEAGSALQLRLERLLGDADETTLDNLQMLAVARTELGDFAAAEDILKKLLERRAQAKGEMHSRTVSVQTRLAILYLRQQRFADAEHLLRPLLAKAEVHFGKRSFAVINFSSLLGSALRLGGKREESGPYYLLALERAREVWGADNAITLSYELNYANFEVASDMAAAALKRLDRIAPPFVAHVGSESPENAELLRTRGQALAALNQIEVARSAWQQALAIDRKVFGDDRHPQVMRDLASIAELEHQ
jgi:eukaryotic-like serine/threonine-protein kinase